LFSKNGLFDVTLQFDPEQKRLEIKAIDGDRGEHVAACDAEVKAFALCYATADHEEGARAFLEKRKPVFTGK